MGKTAAAKTEGFKAGDHVMYRRYGICSVTAVKKVAFAGQKKRTYYLLESVYGNSIRFYVPADMEDIDEYIRPMLSKAQINRAIKKAETFSSKWESDDSVRSEKFNNILKSGDIAEVLWLVKMLSRHKVYLKERGKNFLDADKQMLAAAEKLVTDELAFVLNIEKDKVIPYILDRIKGQGAK